MLRVAVDYCVLDTLQFPDAIFPQCGFVDIKFARPYETRYILDVDARNNLKRQQI